MDRKTVLLASGIIAAVLAVAGLSFTALNPFTGGNQIADNASHEVVAENLDIPWEIEFLPGGDMLVTERPGTLLRIDTSGETTRKFTVRGVEHRGEGGLLGLALHPEYEENNWIYLYMTTETGDGLTNRVVRYSFNGSRLSNATTVIDDLPGAPYHDGGRIEFGPEEKLFITAGDATNGEWAQREEVLAGKILRINPDGSIPEDNPFDNAVYSYGHRNPQGLAWVDGQLWATEHGRSGLKSGMDELNIIEKGKNYGWPVIEGDEEQDGMTGPVIHSGSDVTWAPAGAAYLDGSIYFAGLRGSALYEAEIEGREVIGLEKHLEDQFGRLRAVVKGPDGDLYVSTSNTDGRGNPVETDDRIIRVDPGKLD